MSDKDLTDAIGNIAAAILVVVGYLTLIVVCAAAAKIGWNLI